MTTTIFVNMLAFATLLSSVFSITSKNPVISVIFLISTFVSGAGYLILIGINFVGISYIIVYVGAIAVLFLFVIMMINIKLTDILETGSQYTKNFPLAIAIGSLFIFIIFSIIPFNFNNVPAISIFLDKVTYLNTLLSDNSISSNALISKVVSIDLINTIVNINNLAPIFTTQSSDVIISDFQQIEALGYSLYTYGAVLLITLSVILLLAMYATIVISSPSKPSFNKNPTDSLDRKAVSTRIVSTFSSSRSSSRQRLLPLLVAKGPLLSPNVQGEATKNTKLELPKKAWLLTILADMKGGLKDAIKDPLYPEHIIKLNNNKFVKIFKTIGGLCFFIHILTRKYDLGLEVELYGVVWSFSVLYMIYRLILVFYQLKKFFQDLFSGKYIKRNSPLSYGWTMIRTICNGIKGTGGFIIGTGVTISVGFELDDILASNNYNRYFIPNFQKLIKDAGLEPAMNNTFERFGITKNAESVIQVKKPIDINSLTLEEKVELEKQLGIKHESLVKFFDHIRNSDKSSISKEIQEEIQKNDPFNTKK